MQERNKERDLRIAALDRALGEGREAVSRAQKEKEELVRANSQLTATANSLKSEVDLLKRRLDATAADAPQDNKVVAATRRLQSALYKLGAYTGEIDGRIWHDDRGRLVSSST